MLQSKLFTKTKKELSKDEEATNACLLIKAGYIDKVMAGAYTFLPLGLRVLKKIENIIREEMNNIGGQEILMPALHPKNNWEQTKRWDTVDVLFRLKSRHDKEYALGLSHEEVVVPLAQQFIFSYKDLPQAMYQIQNKFRDEARAKSGLLRGFEFGMKDMYSFHQNKKNLEKYYNLVGQAYEKIWQKVGIGDLTYKTFASGGIFSKYSHEYQTICGAGEDTIFKVPNKNLVFNKEIAPSKASKWNNREDKPLPMEDVLGEGLIGVKELSDFLKIPVKKTTKTILFENEKGELIAGAVRGDYDINELKLCDVANCKELKLANQKIVKEVTGAEIGYAGILNLPKKVKIYMDDSMKDRVNFECGANKTNYHTINVNFGRDLPQPEKIYDIKVAKKGDYYPETNQKYEVYKAVEVGNIFLLNTKFSDAFKLKYSDEKGKLKSVYMGCYGTGPGRLMGTLVEIFHDDNGIIWPANVAPFKYHLINLSKNEKISRQAKDIYQQLTHRGDEVLFDDRPEASPGEKLKDADLIGIPYRLVVSDKTNSKIEVKKRNQTKTELKDPSEL